MLLVGLLMFAVVTAIMLLRARAGWARLETSSHDEIAALRADLDRANALLASEPQVMVDWPAASDEPSIEGDPAVVGVSAPHRVLAFGCWLDAGRATAMEQAVEALRARGEAFAMAFTTLSGRPIEAQGRAIAGRAVLRLKDASGVKRELLDLAGRHEALLSEIASLRALVEKLPSPVWMRDAAGRLTFVNAAYARAVEANDAADAIERNLELLDSAARDQYCASAPCQRRLFRAPARDRCRRPAELRRARLSAPRPAAPGSASTPPKPRPCAARWPAWSTHTAARSISFRPASPCSTPIRS